MESNYDEELSENKFFQELQQKHGTILKRAINEGWIICVPRCNSFTSGILLEDDFLEHILIPNDELPVTHFRTLNGKEVKLCNRVLTVEYDIARPCSSHLLFEETFYTEDSHKYRVWCIECPLEQSSNIFQDFVPAVSNFRECIDLLWTEILDKNILNELDSAIDEFNAAHEHLENEPLHNQRDLVGALYAKNLRAILKDTRLRDKTTSSRHFLQTIKIAVETHVLHGLRRILSRSVSTCMAFEDASLNKTVKNLHELQLKDLGVRSDLYDGVVRAKLELSRLDGFCTVLGKIGCLKRAIHFLSAGEASLSSDDLLPVLIFLVIKAGLPNWIAQLTFMKQFRFSVNSVYEADEAGFLITSLEAAVEHVRSGVLTGSQHLKAENLGTELLANRKANDKTEETSLSYLFECVRKADLSEVERILSKEVRQLQNNIKLCHPLCSCETCERTLADHLQSGLPTVHSRDDKGLTALHVACLHGRAVIVDFLLGHDANANDIDAGGVTPLHCAASRGHQNALLLLLHANADPNITDTQGNSALHLAADNGHEGCVKALVYFARYMKLSLNVNCVNFNKNTALHNASKWGYSDIVEILLEHGANPKIANRRGQTPLALAHNAYVSRLLETDASNNFFLTQCSSSSESSPLRSKVVQLKNKLEPSNSTEKLRRVERLLSAIAEGDIRLACYYLGLEGPLLKSTKLVSNLCHPLCDCEMCASIDEVSDKHEIPELGINACDGDERTALHVASANGCTEIVQLLLDAGAMVGLKTKSEGRTPLHLACENNRLNVVKLLLNCGACDVDVKDNVGDTPLHLACRTGNTKLVELLVRHGVNIKVRNLRRITPLDEAKEKMSLDIIRVFKGYYASQKKCV